MASHNARDYFISRSANNSTYLVSTNSDLKRFKKSIFSDATKNSRTDLGSDAAMNYLEHRPSHRPRAFAQSLGLLCKSVMNRQSK